MITPKLKDYLDSHNVDYEQVVHIAAITAQEVAAAAHVPGKEFAKTVMVKLDDRLVMVIMPAQMKVNLGRLREETGASHAELADESEFSHLFPECEVGAMPPFGNLYGLEVFIESSMMEDEQIAFNAGTHEELVKMWYRDFEGLVQPRPVDIAPSHH